MLARRDMEIDQYKAPNARSFVGFDVTDGRFKNMIEAGIVDPAEVLTEALANAVSVAVQLVCTSTLIIPDYDKSKLSNLP